MTQFTEEWVRQQNAKRLPKFEPVNAPFEGLESELHQKIENYCKSKGWYVVHSRMDRKSTNDVGTPDFIIATRSGTLWVEAKRKGNKPTEEQRNAHYWLRTLGHDAHFVWSFEDFEAAAKKHS